MATEEIDGLPVDLDRLPPELQRPRRRTIRHWAGRDESERDAAHEAASTEELAAYWLRVSQRFPAINAYLERTHRGPARDEAILVGVTAEAALEAAAEIERRTGQRPEAASAGASARSGGGRASSASRRSRAGPGRARRRCSSERSRAARLASASPRRAARPRSAGPRRSAGPDDEGLAHLSPRDLELVAGRAPRGSA